MTKLVKHIEVLLLDNDCVIVPGFGGFMAHHVDAMYVEDENCFLPPSRTLGFNPQLHINDSLLVQSYVETYDISYPEALRNIEDDVRELKQTLDSCGTYELTDIGVIRVNVHGKYEFEPCLSGILTPELYALNSFEMPLLSNQKAVKTETVDASEEKRPKFRCVHKKHKKEEAPKDAELEVVVDEQIENNAEEMESAEETTARTISINITTLRNIAAAAILLVMFVFASMPVGDASKRGETYCSIDTSILTKFMPQVQVQQDEEMTPVKVINNTVVATERTSEEEAKAKAETATVSKDEFVIVLASKISKKNAEEYIKVLKADGIKDARLDESTSAKKVVCGRFDSEAEANTAARILREKSPSYGDAWIMRTTK